MISSVNLGGGSAGLLTYVLLILILYITYQLAVAAKRQVAIRKLGGQRAYLLTTNPVTGMACKHPLQPARSS